MDFDIVLFSPANLEELCNFMIENHGFDHFTPELLDEKVPKDPDFDPELALCAYHHEGLVGFAMAVLRDNGKGFVKLIAVKQWHRRRGIGTKLYQELEVRLKKRGCRQIEVYNCTPNFFLPGVDPRYTKAVCFFERQGFTQFDETVNMVVDLRNPEFCLYKKVEKLKRLGIFVNKIEAADENRLIDFVQSEFPVWRIEVMSMIAHRTAFIATIAGKVIGFSGYEGNNIDQGWFGPMGVQEKYSGNGVGALLLATCLQNMRNKYEKAVIPWVGPLCFYSKVVGATVDRVFWQYRKKL
jgi:GNAT superfamily N-acetyltransferase